MGDLVLGRGAAVGGVCECDTVCTLTLSFTLGASSYSSFLRMRPAKSLARRRMFRGVSGMRPLILKLCGDCENYGRKHGKLVPCLKASRARRNGCRLVSSKSRTNVSGCGKRLGPASARIDSV